MAKKKKKDDKIALLRVSNPVAKAALYTTGGGFHKNKRKSKSGGAKTWRRYLED